MYKIFDIFATMILIGVHHLMIYWYLYLSNGIRIQYGEHREDAIIDNLPHSLPQGVWEI
jgi:hypothetical protein